MARRYDTIYHRSTDVENEILRNRLQEVRTYARDILSVLGPEEQGFYLSFDSLEYIKNKLKGML